jgi:predicted NBD/HSP70 family sugar kinase
MAEKADSELVRRQNRRLVLEALRHQGPMARIELGRSTGLSPASITAISSQLIDERAIEEVAAPLGTSREGKRGRPLVQLALTSSVALVVAVKISIDDVVLQLADFQGRVRAQEDINIATYSAQGESFALGLVKAIETFLTRLSVSLSEVRRIGIALQGVPDQRHGSILWSPAFQNPNVPLVDVLEQKLGIECQLANDANMIAEGLLAEHPEHFTGVSAVIFSGYGVGMGLVIDGKVFHGSNGAASEFGHMNHVPDGAMCRCGRKGCVEAYAADYALLRTAYGTESDKASLTAIEPQKILDLMAEAEARKRQAVNAFETAGRALGFGIARLIAILNPDRIVLAGPGMKARALIEPAMRQALADGVVDVLSKNVSIEYVDFSADMIMRGTVAALMRSLDHEVSSGLAVRETHALALNAV